MKPGFVNTIRNLNRSPCNGRKRKNAKKFKVQKSASKLMATIFGIVKARAVVQKRRGSYRAECCFKDNASVHTARVSRQALKDTGFSEIDHHLQPRSSSQRLFPFFKGVTWS
ncbi:hypothetical protein EVAR_42490_1 [Eumeta japonica]|uniref:Mariner Mos1 transposase n=1 Tax=Eumeta variegata TaxID=151549 RepID=A0A4C1Y2B7_EUMVA|nr:hypothetical protein EVAR_42490_1 [Eumeta japonica]